MLILDMRRKIKIEQTVPFKREALQGFKGPAVPVDKQGQARGFEGFSRSIKKVQTPPR